MESNASSFLLNQSSFQSVYYQGREDEGIIDLGLSLRTLQPEACRHQSENRLGEYGDLMHWPQSNPTSKQSDDGNQRTKLCGCDEEAEGVQSKERWAYVKVNMDGVVVGRKICILDHASYSSLALQLEDMFGMQTPCGLKLFQADSEFCLLYKDTKEKWSTVGDIPWKEFMERVKRLRIARRNETPL